ncbi:GNAT family N-acetyltransferase [Mycobacterium sp. CBMA 213]|nr:GNAT family N-acetyltransferase [Mycolicibacterium sp. CBMA 213]
MPHSWPSAGNVSSVPESITDELASLGFFSSCKRADLDRIAPLLRPLTAAPGEVLMTQGEPASSFMLIGSGSVRVTHAAPDGELSVHNIGAGLIIGEIALLREGTRNATVVVTEPLTGWIGGHDALTAMLDVPCMAERLVRTARQRLAAFITPLPVTLRDGSRMYLRPVLPGDNPRVRKGPVEFSTETMYRRFQTAYEPSPALMAYLFEVDYVDHFVWVLTDGAEGPDGPMVADARFVRLHEDPTVAEVAFMVGDDYQGRGIGTFLMDALVPAARGAGIERFAARVLSDNYPMRKILEHYGAKWERDDRNMIVTEFDVPEPNRLALSHKQYRDIYTLARYVLKMVH